jgi:hypothetical protein
MDYYIAWKKGIDHLSVSSIKEGMIEGLKDRLESQMSMKIPDHHILKMFREDKS